MDPRNLVYPGAEGTGAAFLLKGNRAADIFEQGAAKQAQAARLAEIARQKQLAAQEAAAAKFLQGVKAGVGWENDDEYLRTNHEKNMEYAAQLKAEGKDPSKDVTFLNNHQKNLADAAYSKAAGQNYQKFIQEWQKNPDKIENADELISYYTKPFEERRKSGLKPPEPIMKHSLADAIKASGGTVAYEQNADGTYDTTKVNRAAIIDQGINSTDTKEAQYIIKKAGGDTTGFIKGFPVVTQDGKRLWNTKGDEFKNTVISELDENPDFVPHLRQLGYDVSDPGKTIDSAMEYAKKQNEAVGTYIKDYADALGGRGKSVTKRIYTDEANRRANEQLAISKERLGLARDKANEPDTSATYRQDWINGMFDGEEGSGEKLKAALKGNGSYRGELKIERIKSAPDKVVFNIPEKVTESTDANGMVTKKVTPGRRIVIDKNSANDKIALNQIINEITKENVNISQLMTPGGKKKVANGKGAESMTKPSADPLNLF